MIIGGRARGRENARLARAARGAVRGDESGRCTGRCARDPGGGGGGAISPDRLAEALGEAGVTLNTVNAPNLARNMRGTVRSDVPMLDQALPPGGRDLPAGRELGLAVMRASGEAGSASRTAGRDDRRVISGILRDDGVTVGGAR